MFSIHRVEKQSAEDLEPLGSKYKFWFSSEETRVLFKAEERGTGEDWAEKIACQLCELIGLPHIHYELAELYDRGVYIQPGVVCKTCAPPPLSLVLGNQLLLERDPQYPADEQRKYKVRAHTPDTVADVVRGLAAPAACWMTNVPIGIATALDVFVGYLLLDVWVANQDRHHENWGALRDVDVLRLAPTFDHGACLARNITDEERTERLTSKDQNRSVTAFSRRARSAFYSQATASKPLTTLEALTAFASFAVPAARTWLKRLGSVGQSMVEGIVNEVPDKRMTRITKDFTLRLLMTNQERLQKESL
jgi:hypothetical protein